MEKQYRVITPKECIKHIVTPEGTAEIINKYDEGGTEVNVYLLRRDGRFHLKPPKKEGALKTYFIVKGTLYSVMTKTRMGPGTMILLRSLDDLFHVSALEDTELLVHSLQDPSYAETEREFNHIYHILVQIQEKDSYTFDHSQNVYDWTLKMAEKLDYCGTRLQNLLWAAKYHDIGKIHIPDEILNKPGRLTNEEFAVMKSHVVKGEAMILESFNRETYDIIHCHHERLDGSGYPRGLKGTAIPQEARILGICDSFDAMTSDRVYKKGKTVEEAIKELRALSGSFYDPELVELFIGLVKESEEK